MPLQPAVFVVGALLAVAIAPVAGVALATRRMRLSRVVAVVVSVTLGVCLASALVQLVLAEAADGRTIAASHAALAAVLLAVAALGCCCGARFSDPLDAVAMVLGIAVIAALGVPGAGPLLEVLPRRALGLALLANPIVAVASAAGIDLFRTPVLYQLSPIAHTQVDYPTAFTACVSYGAAALTLFTGTALIRPRAGAISLERMSA